MFVSRPGTIIPDEISSPAVLGEPLACRVAMYKIYSFCYKYEKIMTCPAEPDHVRDALSELQNTSKFTKNQQLEQKSLTVAEG